MQQQSEEWIRARLGKATASRASDWMAELKTGGVPAAREAYAAELAVERLTNAPVPSYQSQAMLEGIEREPAARAAYAFWANTDVTEVGFIPHPQIANAGASPDGLIGDDGLVEIKCPALHTHIKTLLKPDKVAGEYMWQMQFQLACTGRQWCDYVSYNPNFPNSMRLSVARVLRSAPMIAKLEIACVKFLVEVDMTVEQLTETYGMLEAA